MHEKGFTLLEMVLAVAMLSVSSLFILQFFIGGHNLNARAADLDQSVWMVQETLEAFKAEPNPESFMSGNWIPESKAEGLVLKYSLAAEPQLHAGSVGLNNDAEGMLYTLTVQVVRTKPYWLEDQGERLVYEGRLQRYIHEKVGEAYVETR